MDDEDDDWIKIYRVVRMLGSGPSHFKRVGDEEDGRPFELSSQKQPWFNFGSRTEIEMKADNDDEYDDLINYFNLIDKKIDRLNKKINDLADFVVIHACISIFAFVLFIVLFVIYFK
ncbi:MAG: hypothetical protein M1505_01980 [Patescibacteria group bacterium]|nr:hypothetical protein [Patescibacteria group bacterium]MCL5257975.1 hypothetical protein [Patescibacteria group bacterium]